MKTFPVIKLLYILLLSSLTAHTQTWEFVGLDSMVIKHLFVSGDTIWAGTAHRVGNLEKSGFYKSTDAGSTWVQLDSVLGVGTIDGIYIDKEHTMNIFISKGFNAYTGSGTFFKTTDGGENWKAVQRVTNSSIAWFGVSPFNKNEIYFTAGGEILELYKSNDGGETWEISGDFPVSSHGSLLTFSFDLTDSMSLYVTDDTSFDQYLFKSTNKGDSWFYVSELPVTPVETKTDLFLPGRLYLFAWYKASDDGGFTWYDIDSGIPNYGNYLSFYMNDNYPNELFNLRKDGLYIAKNGTINWNLIGGTDNLPLNIGSGGFAFSDVGQMTNIFIEVGSNQFYVGTAQGIYKSNLITDIQEEINSTGYDFHLEQNHPNPFNPSTTISYLLPERSFITIRVYDILGKEIRSIIEEEQSAGQYELEFESNNLPSGFYIYVLTASSENGLYIKEGKKMILIK